MLRHFLTVAAALTATSAFAQAGPAQAPMQTDCLVRMSAAPAAWMLRGYDPFGGETPQATFNITYINGGGSECRFTPSFETNQQTFGLSKGTGRSIGYALLNLTDSQDVTPRAGRSLRTASQRELVLAPNESKTFLYKLVANPDDVRDSGTFTQDIRIEAQDRRFRSLGGTQIVLGLEVLPSARMGLSGAYSMADGHAVVDLGELRPGVAPVPLHLRVNSTGQYDLQVTSANSGKLRLGASDWTVPYSVAVGGTSVNLSGAGRVSGPTGSGYRRDSLPIQFVIGDTSDRRAGTYSDVISISVTAR
ncbi:hypothetical protein SAMN05428974_0826 [Sphingopyxis sp. YR583]|uniref:hypothetical protein n=1 Tax=Sphingopyxis sp. YR583 TaxID=1881047 RepID=UPI0008A8020B|nr:hypothetical protein [Sphingopyxis sp. YR583]SEH13562.1 hypothetical protein SAMN05428974_0826 [Sphingopyxis sp. YR583]